jgi:hypothetical protein
MALTMTAEEVRQQLGAYLTKPLEVTSGTLSTQQSFSATSMSTGGLSGDFIIDKNGRILVFDETTCRVVIGKLS